MICSFVEPVVARRLSVVITPAGAEFISVQDSPLFGAESQAAYLGKFEACYIDPKTLVFLVMQSPLPDSHHGSSAKWHLPMIPTSLNEWLGPATASAATFAELEMAAHRRSRCLTKRREVEQGSLEILRLSAPVYARHGILRKRQTQLEP